MAQANSVLSTPRINTPICQSAPGAVQLSSRALIPTSPANAGRGVTAEPEPRRNSAIPSVGAVVSRRLLMNVIVGSAAVAVGAAALPCQPAAAKAIAIDAAPSSQELRDLSPKQNNNSSRLLAEGVGFEPTVPLQARRFSRPVP
jgi:hypothetical protein